jgi:hypothetical protein
MASEDRAKKMAEPEKQSIPPEYAEAFRAAVSRFSDWSGGDEPHVTVDQEPVLISAVCLRVDNFGDKLPADLFQTLYGRLHQQHEFLKIELTQDPSYHVAAQCLFQLIMEKKAEYRNRS